MRQYRVTARPHGISDDALDKNYIINDIRMLQGTTRSPRILDDARASRYFNLLIIFCSDSSDYIIARRAI